MLIHGQLHGAILGLTRFGETECALARGLEVVARIGVGYDAIDVPALTRRRVPLMLVGTANSSGERGQSGSVRLGERSSHMRKNELRKIIADGSAQCMACDRKPVLGRADGAPGLRCRHHRSPAWPRRLPGGGGDACGDFTEASRPAGRTFLLWHAAISKRCGPRGISTFSAVLPFGAAEWMSINLECRGSNPAASATQSLIL